MERLSQSDITRNAVVYDVIFAEAKKYGTDYHGWDPHHKEENFARMISMIRESGLNLSGASAIDVGCGFGDLNAFLKMAGAQDYVGIDIYEPSLTVARENYPRARFENLDILEPSFQEKFDFAFASGSLTTRLASDNYKFLEAMIAKMWLLSRKGVGFNFLAGMNYDWDYAFAYNPRRVMRICNQVAPEARIIAEPADRQYHVLMLRS